MKKNKINIGLITIFLLIALLGHCREAKIRRESKIANDIKFNAVE